jgi:hypothetical protein
VVAVGVQVLLVLVELAVVEMEEIEALNQPQELLILAQEVAVPELMLVKTNTVHLAQAAQA